MNVPIAHSASLFTDSTVDEWTVPSQPELVIGGPDERDGFAIGRFGGAVLLEDRVVIADAAFGEIRFYATDGELVNRVRRSGSGPYEFRAIRAIARHGDSAIVVWDVGLGRLTTLGRNGERRRILLPDLSRAVSIASSFIGVVRGGQGSHDQEDAVARDRRPCGRECLCRGRVPAASAPWATILWYSSRPMPFN